VSTLSAAVSDFLRHSQSSNSFSPLTLRSYSSDLNYLLRFLGNDLAIEGIRGYQLQHYKKHLLEESGLGISSIKRRITALKALFHWLEQRGQIETTLLRESDLKIDTPRRADRGLFPRARLYH
jgi:site-specific recombinase XerD